MIPEALLYTSDALSEMRDRSARETDFRIVWGGRGVMTASQQPFDVFLSHNSKDKPIVRELAAALKAQGFTCFLGTRLRY